MKRLFYIAIVILGTIAFVAGSVYAGSFGPNTGSCQLATSPELTIQTSKNVYLDYAVDGGGTQAQQQNYGISTVHFSGDKEYGTSNNTTQIYFNNVSTGDTAPTVVGTGLSTLGSPWTSM
jgi:hypothetical protein